jgi:hypothetical protein
MVAEYCLSFTSPGLAVIIFDCVCGPLGDLVVSKDLATRGTHSGVNDFEMREYERKVTGLGPYAIYAIIIRLAHGSNELFGPDGNIFFR